MAQKKHTPDDTQDDSAVSFEEALAQLEQVIRDLEDGRLGLNESLVRYEDGVRMLRHCHQSLNEAERKILLLTGVGEDGKPVTERFDDESLTLEEKKESRSRRRTSGTAKRVGRSDDADLAGETDGSSPDADEGDMDRQKGLF